MFTEGLREIWMEIIDEYGWADKRDQRIKAEAAQKTARKLLLRGLPVEDVAEDTELPLDTVIAIANQLQELPAGV